MHLDDALCVSGSVDSKSQVQELNKKIDGLVRTYIESGSEAAVEEASKLSRRRERLLKPKVIRMRTFKEAG